MFLPLLVGEALAAASVLGRPVGETTRVTLELEWTLGEVEVSADDRDPFAPFLRKLDVAATGSRKLVWLDETLAADEQGAATAYRRTWEELEGEDELRIDSPFGRYDVAVQLASPLAACTHVARRSEDGWEGELVEGEPPDGDPGAFDRLAWEVELADLMPREDFVYLSGRECRRLLRPVGWPPWRGSGAHPRREETTFLTASPLTYPRLDDPRLVVRRPRGSAAGGPLLIEVEVRETLDLSDDARSLGLLAWFGTGQAILSIEAAGRGELCWSVERGGPGRLELTFDAKLRLDLGGVRLAAEGTLRQTMSWERVPGG